MTPLPVPADAEIASRVWATPLADTHEHLVEEEARTAFQGPGLVPCDDWATLFSHYLDADLRVAGMPAEDHRALFSPSDDPESKWRYLEPWWPRVKNTGYGRAVRIAVERLYGIGDVCAQTIGRLQAAYASRVRPGFYREVLCEAASIEYCQVNSLQAPFCRTRQPLLLMQDLSILGMHMDPASRALAEPASIQVRDLADWHAVIRWWFDAFAPYAVAVKSQAAYGRKLDYAEMPAEAAAPIFRKIVEGEPVPGPERKKVEDHLFWFCVRLATERQLPVKLHTGYHAGHGSMNLDWVQQNARHACDLLRRAPDTKFVFMHIGYPYQSSFAALAKHYSNAYLDFCWAWIIDPVSSRRFLEQLIVTVPANKILVFGGDFIPVEPVVGHAEMARQGVAAALSNLVGQGYLDRRDALDLVDPLMRGNAAEVFQVDAKRKALAGAPWLDQASNPADANSRASGSAPS
ncbi:MAG: amidohydrolase family protein [Chthonomonadales bacterium]